FLVGIPSFLVTIFGALGRIHRSGMRWSVPMILVALGLWGWVTGGLGAVLDSVIQINQVTHNTLWVPAHFHTYYLLGAAAFPWAFASRPSLTRKSLYWPVGRWWAASWVWRSRSRPRSTGSPTDRSPPTWPSISC